MAIAFGKGDVLFQQRLLKCGGFYSGGLDGSWGPISRAAAVRAEQSYLKTQETYGKFDSRSETNIATLLPPMQIMARQLLQVAREREKNSDIYVQILSGTRTYAEQDALFSQRPIVTKARGGQSNHNFGIALDVGLFKNGKYLTGFSKAETKAYTDFAQAVKSRINSTLAWGGDWTSFPDIPHYEMATGLSIAQKRAKFEKGQLNLQETT